MLTVAMAFVCCNRNTIYSHFESIDNNGWKRQDTLRFETEPVEKGGTFDNWLSLRSTSAYPYTGITMIVYRHIVPNGTERTDTINVSLIDEDGDSKGKGFHHKLHTIPLSSLKIGKGERLVATIRHFMKQETLPGISALGLTVRMKD